MGGPATLNASYFFEADRQKFFRPLNSSRRELVVACLRALYERLHGPAADYAHSLSRELLKELIVPVVREHHDQLDLEEQGDEFSALDGDDINQLTALVIRVFLRDGWLEQFPERQGLTVAFRFSRPGKLFAEAFWLLDRPSRSRQRNMRGCRNALEAALSDRGDAHDLVDAYEYAEKVIEDLTDGIDYLQERVRQLMQEATAHAQWDDFVEFLERFQRDYSKQLTADSATLNRYAIRQKLEGLRTGLPDAKFQRIENQLHEVAHWAVQEHTGSSVLEWLLDRVEDIVNAACDSKQPGFIKAMETYIRRVTGLVQQSMMIKSGQSRHIYLQAIKQVSECSDAVQERLLGRIAQEIAAVEVRLLDPSSFRIRAARQKKKALTVSVPPRASREARLEAVMNRAEAEAFAVANDELTNSLRASLRLYKHPVRISSLPLTTARELLGVMQTVEAVRSSKAKDLVANQLPGRVENEFYRGRDYEVHFEKNKT